MKRALLWAAVALAPGCQSLLGEVDKAECALDEHCFDGEICNAASRCVVGQRDAAPPASDMDAEDARPALDPDAAPPDAGPLDAAPPDAGSDDAPYPESLCFADFADGVFQSMSPGRTHVPRAFCTEYGAGWTEEDPLGRTVLRVLPDPGGETIELPPGVRVAARGAFVAAPVVHPNHGFVNIKRVDLRDGTAEFVAPRATRQSEPVLGEDVVGFVEQDDAGKGVVVFTYADGRATRCGMTDRTQWGLALDADGAAWFEGRPGSRRATLVLSPGLDCANDRLELVVAGSVGAEARVHVADGRRLWLERTADGLPRVVALALDDLGAGPEALTFGGVEVNPIDLAAGGHWLAVVSYSPRRHVLDLFDLDTGRHVGALNRGNALAPTLTARYVVWADQQNDAPWKVLYVAHRD